MKKDKKSQEIELLRGNINAYETTVHETINVLLNVLNNEKADVLDYKATLSVVIGNLLYTSTNVVGDI